MKTKDTAESDAKLIIDMYDYALTNDLDIINKNDVISILKALGQEKVTNDRVERLMMAYASELTTLYPLKFHLITQMVVYCPMRSLLTESEPCF